MKVQDLMLTIYLHIDDFLKAHPELIQWRRSPNRTPRFCDAEVLTISLLQPWLGQESLAQTYRFLRNEHQELFPRLCSYKQFVRRLNQLGPLTGSLFEHVTSLLPIDPSHYVVDSKPIPLCKPIRHGRVRLLREEGAFFSKSSTGWYFGYKLHTVTDARGWPLAAVLLPASVNDRDAMPLLMQGLDGKLVIARSWLQWKRVQGADARLLWSANRLHYRSRKAG